MSIANQITPNHDAEHVFIAQRMTDLPNIETRNEFALLTALFAHQDDVASQESNTDQNKLWM